jgi:putative spermidine/putrescine transport system permease protein
LPKTIAALRDWDGNETPDESVFAALVTDLRKVSHDGTAAFVGKRLNYEISGVRSKIITTVNKVTEIRGPPYKDQIIKIDKLWGDRLVWTKIKQAGRSLTDFYLLRSLDLERNADGNIVSVSRSQAVYVNVLIRTFYISALVTLITLVLGYPVAFMLAHAPQRLANILLIFILIPFWTSLLVRTTAWFVLLQDNGPINDFLHYVHIADEPLKLIFSRFGTVTAMVHIQLPFTLLPIFARSTT